MLEMRVESEKTLSKEEELIALSDRKMEKGNIENGREKGKKEEEKDERDEEDD